MTPMHDADQDPIHRLVSFHGRIRQMFVSLDRIAEGELEGERALAAAREVLDFLEHSLPQHDVAEESLFVPLLLEHASGEVRETLAQLRKQHVRLEAQVGELTDELNRVVETQSFEGLSDRVGPIRRAFHEHLSWEELEMFPLARRCISAAQLHDLALKMAQIRR